MKKYVFNYFLISLALTGLLLVACSGSDDSDSGSPRAGTVTIDTVTTDDIIDTVESQADTQTISGTASGGSIDEGDAVSIIVNGNTFATTLTNLSTYTQEVTTTDLIADTSIEVNVVSTNNSGSVTSRAVKTITLDIDNTSNGFVHPGLLATQSDFDRIKSKVDANEEPWLSGWNKLISNSHAQLSYTANPVVKLIRGGNSTEEPEADNYARAFNDAAAAFQLAVRWKVSGNDDYADRAISILNAWASTCTSLSGNSNIVLGAGIYGYQFANAAEIMRDYNGWNSTDFEAFKQWLVDLFLPISQDFLVRHNGTCISHYWANWDLVSIANIISIGVLTDDQSVYDTAISYLKTGAGNGNLNTAVYYIHPDGLGQLQESGRDQGHTLLCVGYLGEIAQMVYNQGEDLFAYDDNRILKGAEYAAKYNVANLGVPFELYNNCNNVNHTVVSDDGRGEARPIWQLLYNHYVVKKGLSSQYLELAAENLGVEGGGGDYGPNSGGYDSLGFGTLLYALPTE